MISLVMTHQYMFSSFYSTEQEESEFSSDITDTALLNNYDMNAEQCLLCEYIDLKANPTFVILDSGCTRSMGSRFAVDRLVQACRRHPKSSHIAFTTEPCRSHFSFANGEQSHVTERLIIHLRNDQSATGWITTSVDILDKGQVPILFSVEQMRNLRMNIEHTPVGEFLTCPLFGMKRTALAVSTSNHPVLDTMSLALASKKPNHSFVTSFAITCPACNGKHRAHTYKEGCAKHTASTSKTSGKTDKSPEAEPSSSSRGDTSRMRKTRISADPDQVLKEPPEPQPDAEDEIPEIRLRPGESVEPEPRPEIKEDEEPKTEPKVKVEEKKEPSPSMNLPLALQRTHAKLQSPTELLKLHLKHHHMSTEQFKRRTSALKLPKEIYEKYDSIVKQCETCEKAKVAPTRAKVSGI